MSERKGKLVTCDRCGTEVFLQHVVSRNGFECYDDYKPLPNDWLTTTQLGELCPECAKVFRSFISHFMKSTNCDLRVASSWQIDNPLSIQEIHNNIAWLMPPIQRSEVNNDQT